MSYIGVDGIRHEGGRIVPGPSALPGEPEKGLGIIPLLVVGAAAGIAYGISQLSSMEGGSSHEERMGRFSGGLQSALKAVNSGNSTILPQLDKAYKTLENAANQINSLQKMAENFAEDPAVSDALDTAVSTYKDTESTLSDVLEFRDQIRQQLSVYEASKDSISPWNPGSPGEMALTKLVEIYKKSQQKLLANIPAATRTLDVAITQANSKIRSAISKAKSQAQADAQRVQQEKFAQIRAAQESVNDTISSAYSMTQNGDVEGALDLLSRPDVLAAAALGNMNPALQQAMDYVAQRRTQGSQTYKHGPDYMSSMVGMLISKMQADQEAAEQAAQQRQAVVQQIQSYAYTNPQYYQYLISLPQYAGLFSAS